LIKILVNNIINIVNDAGLRTACLFVWFIFRFISTCIVCAGSVVLSKHVTVTHYVQRSGFLYYNLTTPLSRKLPLPTTRGRHE